MAQQTTLYDPQPPANSAYVRVLAGNGPAQFDVWVDQKLRLSKVATASPSAYMVLPAGQHEVSLRWGSSVVKVAVKAESSRSLTVLAPTLATGSQPTVVEDKVNGNRLKAIVSAYNLTQQHTVDVVTSDGRTQVFKALAPSHSAALVVNPVNLDYKVTDTNQPDTALTKARLSMATGGAYSIVISTDSSGAVSTQAYPNEVEKYQTR